MRANFAGPSPMYYHPVPHGSATIELSAVLVAGRRIDLVSKHPIGAGRFSRVQADALLEKNLSNTERSFATDAMAHHPRTQHDVVS